MTETRGKTPNAPKDAGTGTVGVHRETPDLLTVGDPDMWRVLCRSYSEREGWMKSTKAMEIPMRGCLVQVTTQRRNPDGGYAVAEALTFVPGVLVNEDPKTGGARLTQASRL